ncbi:hypothetical protein KSP39_PZI021311 [Platanthera zijinensis]|uniref:J domain-containing protein n=1 Tax=Platanthera zijinensis TaxID=2320716 RepID=A0AAP0FW89_9ASPA
MSRGQPRHRSQNARRILERCQNISTKDAIIIDDDTENADVVLIDNPSTSNLGSKNASTTKLNCLPRGIIYIDEEEKEPSNISGDPANNPFAETFDKSSLSEDSDSDDCVMFVGNGNVCCEHSGPSRNNYGLYLDPESSTSETTNLNSDAYEFDDSSSDCEIIEDCSGNIREQWEKAASRKGCCQFTSDQATSSSTTVYPEDPLHEPIQQNSNVGNSFENISSAHFEEIFPEFDLRSSHEPFLQNSNVEKSFENISSAHFEEIFPEFDIRSSDISEESPSINISINEDVDFCLGTTDNISANQSYPNSHIPYEELVNRRKDDESNPNKCPQTAQSEDDGFSFNNDAQEPVKDSFFAYKSHDKTCFTDKEEPSAKTSCDFSSGDMNQTSKANFIFPDKVEQKVDEFSCSAQSKDKKVAEQEFAYFKEGKKGYSDESFPSSTQQYEEPLIHHAEGCNNCSNMDGIVDNKVEPIEGSDLGQTSHNEPDTVHFYGNLIGEREQHKKSEEYRRVAEEEWASRQQQLQIQAEEAQRMRRRRKAEKIRLLDMEKRQKQRLEEIRDLQKKDVEITQLKEHIRVVVRKDLERVEMNCTDMASVLRSLGIHVKGGINPMIHELNAAYKQALLKFHPDRASRTDIRQQVEAEEKFKLISRLKEKLLF